MAELKGLQSLDLSNTFVTDAGLKELARLMRLQTLNLSGTDVTDAGLKELAGLMLMRLQTPPRRGYCSSQGRRRSPSGAADPESDL